MNTQTILTRYFYVVLTYRCWRCFCFWNLSIETYHNYVKLLLFQQFQYLLWAVLDIEGPGCWSTWVLICINISSPCVSSCIWLITEKIITSPVTVEVKSIYFYTRVYLYLRWRWIIRLARGSAWSLRCFIALKTIDNTSRLWKRLILYM